MKAVRIHQYGGCDVIVLEEAPRPVPEQGQVLVRATAAGVGPWDARVRAGKSALPQPLPLTLGSDLAGVVETVGSGVSGFRPGDEIFGVMNSQFTGAGAESAVAEAAMISAKPNRLSYSYAAGLRKNPELFFMLYTIAISLAVSKSDLHGTDACKRL